MVGWWPRGNPHCVPVDLSSFWSQLSDVPAPWEASWRPGPYLLFCFCRERAAGSRAEGCELGAPAREKAGQGEGPSPPLPRITLRFCRCHARKSHRQTSQKKKTRCSFNFRSGFCLFSFSWPGFEGERLGSLHPPQSAGLASRDASEKILWAILELDKTSWALNSGLIGNILEFDLVYSQEKTKLSFLF